MLNNFFKKFFVIALFFFVFPNFVFARPADPSRFPNTPPLRPPVKNILPNYQGNINYQSDGNFQTDFKEDKMEKSGANADALKKQKTGFFINSGKKIGNFLNNWWWLIIIILIIGVTGKIVYKAKKNEKK